MIEYLYLFNQNLKEMIEYRYLFNQNRLLLNQNRNNPILGYEPVAWGIHIKHLTPYIETASYITLA